MAKISTNTILIFNHFTVHKENQIIVHEDNKMHTFKVLSPTEK